MLVVCNSDVLSPQDEKWTYGVLPLPARSVAHAVQEAGHTLVIPETTALEADRHLATTRRKIVDVLNKSVRILEQCGCGVDWRADEIIPQSKVFAVLSSRVGGSGDWIHMDIPEEEDLREAHRRACLREPPLSGDKGKSDEMRDLVIWVMALRLARKTSEPTNRFL